MNRDFGKEEFDLEGQIIKSMLFRGETDRVFAARGIALLITCCIVLFSVLVGFLFRLTGTDLDAGSLLVILGVVFVAGLCVILRS